MLLSLPSPSIQLRGYLLTEIIFLYFDKAIALKKMGVMMWAKVITWINIHVIDILLLNSSVVGETHIASSPLALSGEPKKVRN